MSLSTSLARHASVADPWGVAGEREREEEEEEGGLMPVTFRSSSRLLKDATGLRKE